MRKSELKNWWFAYRWSKVWYWVFRDRVLYKHEDRETAIKPRITKRMWRTTYYPELKDWWDLQPEPKCKYHLFVQRVVRLGKDKEEAIKLKIKKCPAWRWHNYSFMSNIRSKPHYIEKLKRYNPEHYKIEITYKPEEAKVFRDAYLRMINKLEIEYLNEEDTRRWIEIQKSIKWLQWELALFNTFNKT